MTATLSDPPPATEPSAESGARPWEYDVDQEIPMKRGAGRRLMPVLALAAAVSVGVLIGAVLRGAPTPPSPKVVDASQMEAPADAAVPPGMEDVLLATPSSSSAKDPAAAPAEGTQGAPVGPVTTVVGTVRSVKGDVVYVQRPGGSSPVALTVTKSTRVTAARRTQAGAIQPGDAVVVTRSGDAPAQAVVAGDRDLVEKLR